MAKCQLWLLALALTALGLATSGGLADQPKNNPEEEALRKNAMAFAEAFDKGDARALAAFWALDGDYTDQTGHRLKGREAIEKAFEKLFAENSGLKLRIHPGSLRFLTPDVAMEDGVSEVLAPDGTPPSRARYAIVHVKKDGQWSLASVRDTPYTPPSNGHHLRELGWLVGEWADEGDRKEVGRATFEWSANQNFLICTFTTAVKNMTVGGGTQWIGWDPAAKGIRSWTFDTDGSFAEATWSNEGDRWTIKTTTTLPDGKKATLTQTIRRVDPDTLTWQAKDRSVNGQSLPDVPEVTMKRAK